MTTFSTGGSAVTFTTSGSAVSFAVTPASNAFTTSAVLTPGAHASTHGAGGADPITTLGTVTTTLGSAVTLNVGTATISVGTVTTLSATNTATFGSAVSIPTGNPGSPTLRFTGDTNTGIYSPGADQVGIATAGTARVVVGTLGQVTVNQTAPAQYNHYTADAELQVTTTSSRGFQLANFANNAFSGAIMLAKSRGGAGVNTTVSSGDSLGSIFFYGADGSSYVRAAQIVAEVDAAPGTNNMPGRLGFYTTASGTAVPTERMRIDNAGLITGTGTSLGAWTSYTPTLGGTGWAIGNGTAAGVYCRIGKVVHFRAAIRFGTTSTYGGGSARVSIPLAANNTEIGVFTVMYNDASAGTYYEGVTRYVDANTLFCQYAGASGLFTSTSSTAPFTWVDADAIFISGTYETSA